MPSVILPTLHARQAEIYRERARLNALVCGRRFGKDVIQNTVAADRAVKGRTVGLFAPEHKQLAEPFDALWEILQPIKRRSSRTEGKIATSTGGVIDFWHLDDNPLAGRGREYDDLFVNEAAFTKTPITLETWRKALKPTLLVRRGTAWVMSTPNGVDPDNFFWACCNDPDMGFKVHHAPTSSNPLVPAEELERERATCHPLVFQQEYLAKFVDWSGVAFFALDKWLDPAGQPYPYPAKCDTVFAVLDTAVKAGKEHDGTAVMYFALSRYAEPKLMILDYDLIQIEGSLLESWLPTVYQRLDALALACGARFGHQGAFIEDKASGTILLQQAARRDWPARAIDSKLTAVGKDERAISISGYHYQGLVKISQHAYDKQITFKGTTRNHLLTQVMGFRVGDKDAAKRADDLLDDYTYGVSLALGNSDGF